MQNETQNFVAIHNKNGKGLLHFYFFLMSEKQKMSQSTIKMEKGYYKKNTLYSISSDVVAIHNKNGKGLLRH